MSELDRRAFTRIVARIDAALACGNAPASPAELVDLSIGGAYLRVEQRPALETPSRLLLRAPIGGESLVLRGTVARILPDGVGLRFEEVSFETFERLQALLLALGGDPLRMEEELERSWGQCFELPAS